MINLSRKLPLGVGPVLGPGLEVLVMASSVGVEVRAARVTAVALRIMLARRGIGSTLHYGLSRDGGLKAHVWLSVGGTVVIGGAEASDYAEVGTFLPDPPR